MPGCGAIISFRNRPNGTVSWDEVVQEGARSLDRSEQVQYRKRLANGRHFGRSVDKEGEEDVIERHCFGPPVRDYLIHHLQFHQGRAEGSLEP